MTIKDIIKISATYLGDEEVIAYLNEVTDTNDISDASDNSTLSLIDTYTRCANVVISELATSFVPMIKEEQIEKEKITYTELGERLIKIFGVYNDKGEEVKYTSNTTQIVLKEFPAKIVYAFVPSNCGLFDNIDFSEQKITAEVLALGVVAEVYLTRHAFSESLTFRKRYSDAVTSLIPPKNSTTKERRWF